MGRIFLDYQEAARRAGVTIYGIQEACKAGHMKIYVLGEPQAARLLRVVDEADFNAWNEGRGTPRGPRRKDVE